VRNYLALLGWGFDDDDDFFRRRSSGDVLARAGVAHPAVFDEQKLRASTAATCASSPSTS
jgi:hypothetical protein